MCMEAVGERTTKMGNELDSLPSLNPRHAPCYVAPPAGLSVAHNIRLMIRSSQRRPGGAGVKHTGQSGAVGGETRGQNGRGRVQIMIDM